MTGHCHPLHRPNYGTTVAVSGELRTLRGVQSLKAQAHGGAGEQARKAGHTWLTGKQVLSALRHSLRL